MRYLIFCFQDLLHSTCPLTCDLFFILNVSENSAIIKAFVYTPSGALYELFSACFTQLGSSLMHFIDYSPLSEKSHCLSTTLMINANIYIYYNKALNLYIQKRGAAVYYSAHIYVCAML